MRASRLVEYTVTVCLVVLFVSLLAGQLLGQPILLGYVSTGSMAPTLQPNDGYVAVPPALAGDVEEGDVITFNAEELHGGGLTTHRVVAVTDRGYITKGDANAVTDQDGEEPVVEPSQVKAVALQIGGQVVVVPQIGLLVTGIGGLLAAIQRELALLLGTRAVLDTQGLGYIFFGLGVLAYVVSELLESDRSQPARRTTRRETGRIHGDTVVLALTVVLVVLVTASMVVPGGSQSFTVVSSETDAPGPRVIPSGESETLTYVVPSNGLVPVIVYLEPTTEGVGVTPGRLSVPGNSERNATVTLTAPPETGAYDRGIVEHRYIALLPADTIDRLYDMHPWYPIIAVDLLLAIGFAGAGFALLGEGPIRIDSRSNGSLRRRVRRWFQ